MNGKAFMGKMRGSHRSAKTKQEQPKQAERERRTEGPAVLGEHIAMRNANRFIGQQQRQVDTGHGEADHRTPR